MHRFTTHRSPSGLRIGVLAAPRFQRTIVQLWVRAGSRFETSASSGSAHLLEHVLFRGTERYPTRRQLETALRAARADHNAFTEQEWVSVHLVQPRESLQAAIELACEISFRPALNDIDVERRIVEAEIREWNSTGGLVHERLGRLLWGEHALGFPIAGRRAPKTTRRGLAGLHQRFFRPENACLIVAGNVDPTAVRRMVRAAVGDVEPGRLRLPPTPPARRGPVVRFGKGEGKGVRIALHFQLAAKIDDADRLVLEAISDLLWERLNRIVREDRGACYDLEVDCEFGHRYHEIGVYALVRKPAVHMVVREIFRQVRVIQDGLGDLADFALVRDQMVRALTLMVDDLHDLTDYYASQLLLHPPRRIVRPATDVRQLERLTIERCADVAARYLRPAGLAVVLLGDWRDGERPRWRRRIMEIVERFTITEKPRKKATKTPVKKATTK